MAEPTNKGLFDDYKADPVEVGESTGGSLFAAYQTKAFDIDKALERKGRNIEGTLLSKTGLDAESTLGGIVNAGATFLAGGSRFIGNIATSPIDAASYEAQLQVDNEAINAYSRKRAGEEALPGDAELLAASPEFVTDGNTQSNEQRLKSAEGLRDVATTVDKFFNIDSIKDTTQTDKLSDGIADNTAPGIAKLRAAADQYNAGKTMDAIKTGGAGAFEVLGNAIRAGLQNPQGVAEYAAENIPQLAAAAFSGGLSLVGNVGYGLDAGREGLVEFQRDNEGALPTDAERLKMGLFAASAAAAEQVGDIGAVKGILGAGAKSGIVKSATELGKAAAREGVTEGYQTYAEQQAKLKDASIEEIVEGATIGAFVGGTYQGAAEIAKPARNAADKVATNKAVNAAAEAGDVETLAKIGTPTYDPVRAVQVLHREALKDPAKAAESVKRADAIQKDLTEELSAFQERAELFTPENKAGLDRAVETRTAELAAAPADEKAAIRNTLKKLTDLQKSFEQYTPEVAKTEAAQLKELTAKLDATRTAAQQMQIDATPDAPVLEEMQVNANSVDPAVASQAASNILTLTMTNPAAFDSASIEAIASNVANGLSEQQRVALRTYSASQLAANELKGISGVRSDIMAGGDGYKGINQYRDSIRLAMADGNVEAANQQVEGLASFAQSRASKAAAIAEFYPQVKGSNREIPIIRGQNGAWTQAPAGMTKRQLASAGGYTVTAKSFSTLDAVQAEANVLATTAEAFGALIQANPVQETVAAQAADTSYAPGAVYTAKQALGEEQTELNLDALMARAAKGKLTPEAFARTELAGVLDTGTVMAINEAIKLDPVAAVQALVDRFNSSVSQPQVQTNDTAPVDVSTDSNPAADLQPAVPDAQTSPAAESEAVVEATAPEVETTPDAAPTVEATGLTALHNKPEGPVTAENYQDVQLPAAYFTQSAGKDTDSSQKPLVAVDDFMTKVRAGEVKIADFVKNDGEFTPAQSRAVSAFGKFQRWSAPFITEGGFQKNPGKGTERFRFRDYAQFFINEDGSIDENLVTAVSFSMFNWANDSATNLTNGPEGINTILGKDKDEDVTSEAYKVLNEIGVREAAVAYSLGNDVNAALGLKASPSAPANEQARLTTALGQQVIGALTRSGMAERIELSDVTLQKLMNSGMPGNPKVKHTFIRVITSRDATGKLVANSQVAGVREANVGSQSIISKLFGSEKGAVEPSYTPLDFTQPKAKRTNQDVPPVLAERLNKEAKKVHTLRKDVWHLWSNVTSDFLYKVGGYVDINDSPTHVENLASRRSKNDGLIQQVDNILSFVKVMITEKGLDHPLFFGRSVWKPQRVGLTATVLNPQTSKAARSLLAMEGWETDLDMTNPVMMAGFQLRILESLDVKTENGTTVNVLKGYDKVVSNPDIAAAVNELAKVLRDEHTVVDEAVILAGVAAGKAGFHSLDGLIALATVQNAQAKGETKVKVTLPAEVDGVTNGPMLSLLLLGAKYFETMNQGGFFSLAQPYTQFNDYKADGNLDLYQASISAAINLLPAGDAGLAALQVVTGTLQDADTKGVTSKARNMIKKALTPMMFGSNTKKAVSAMADGFVDSIYTSIEELAKKAGDARKHADRAEAEAGLVTLLTAVNTLMGKAGLGLNTKMGINEAMLYKLSDPQKNALKVKFYDLLGKPVEDALNENFAVFLARRDTMNQTAQLAFDVYNAAKEAVSEAAMASSPSVPRSGTGEAFTGLTGEQEAEIDTRLKAMEPILATTMSKQSGQLSAGMHMSKSKRQLDASQQYMSEIWLGAAVPTTQPDGSVAYPKRTETNGMRLTQVAPGAAPMIGSVHSFDSGIASGAYTQLNAVNVHDALIVEMMEAARVGKLLNEQTYQLMLDYSPALEMVNTLERTLAGIPALMADEEVAPRLQAKLKVIMEERAARADKKASYGEYVPATVAEQLESMRHVATGADTVKLSMQAEMSYVNQYATDGGSYAVTADDRAKANELLDKVGVYSATGLDIANQIDDFTGAEPLVLKSSAPVELSNNSVQTRAPATTLNVLDRAKKVASTELAQAITEVQDAMVKGNIPLASAKTVLTPEVAADVVAAAQASTAGKTSVWGDIGTPLVASDARLVAFLSQAKDLTAHQFIDQLASATKDVFTKNLLARVKQATRANVKVVYVTAETGPEGAQGTGVSKARGWYNQTQDTETLYIKSPDFVESGLTEELAVHELLHGALATAIERAQKGGPSDAKDLVNDLEDLRKQAEVLVKRHQSLNKYSNAVSSVHELVSWGMTNAGFQQDVLKAIVIGPDLNLVNKAEAEAEAIEKKYNDKYKAREAEFLALDGKGNLTDAEKDQYVRLEKLLDTISAIPGVLGSNRVDPMVARLVTKEDHDRLLELRKIVRAPAKNRTNSLTDGLKLFIQKLTFLIFRKDAKQGEATGLGLLINHTAGLLNDAAKLHGERESLTLKMQATYDAANQMTPEGIYDALGAAEGTTSAHDTQMRGLLTGIVQSLHGAYGTFHRNLMANQALSSMDVYLKALDTGNRPFASRALASAFVLTKQEAYVLEQVEATVEAAMVSPETLLERTALEKLYREAAAKYNGKPELFHNGDWALAQPHEKAVAAEKMNFLFKPETDATTGKSSYLARFAALALASQEVSGLLNFGTARVEEQLSDLKLGARLMELFRRLLTKLGSLHNKTTPGGQANVVLTQLVDRLVDIEAKRRQRITDGKVSVTDHMEQQLVGLGQGIRNKAVDLSQSTFFKASAQPLIKAAGAAISVVAGERVGDIMDRFTLIRDAAQNKQQGLIMATISEARGVIESNAGAHAFHDIAKMNEATRKQEIDYTTTSVKSAFKDAGAYLTEKVQVAMTKVLLRTNASALLVGRTMSELTSMLESPDAQRAERSRLEQALLALPYGRYYIKSVKQLAHHKVVGSSVSKNLMLSTDNIARLYGDTGLAGTVTDAQAAAATALLDPLMALYALDYSSSSDKSAMIQVLRTENARTDKGNGIEFALKLHAGLQAKSKAELFKGKEALLASGFVPEIHNSKVEVLFIDRTALAGYEKKGYTLVSNLQQDPSAPVQTDKVMITRLGAGQTGLLSGAVSYTGMQAKGSKVDRKAINPLSDDVPTKKAVLTSIKLARAQAIADMFNAPLSYDPRKDKSGNLVPILNAKGGVVNQRYMMTEHSRDVLLERNDALDQVLGVFAGQIVDKLLSPVQNVNVVRGLRDQYKEDYANRPSSYILVGPDSTDERLKELAKLWPDDMKREVKREWKGDNMYIPADQLNLIMGYRKYSLTEAFSKDEEDGIYGAGANWAERLMVRVAGAILGEKAAWQIGKAEDAAQEVVKLIKDILVVKNIFTLVGNIMSNVTLLGAQGVPLMQAIRSHAIGIKGILSYRSDNKRLQQLTQALEVGYVPQGTQAVENEIVLLKDRIARNPVKPLIDAGLMPTIVEDVEINDSQYSYSSRLSKAVDSRTKWVPQLAKDAAKQVFATHDTSIYKFLSQTTQMSDFVARYTMYEYLTTRKLDTKSEADALATAKASFVNYDTPTHRWLQYTNDMGITPFTKYYIRIQATIFRLVKERPARVLALALANHYIAGLQSILDSSWINHLGGNPLSVGPFNLPSVLDELPVVNGLLELLPTSN